MKTFANVTALALMLVLCAPLSASAAVDRAYLYNISTNGSNFNAGLSFLDGGTDVYAGGIAFPIGSISNGAQLETAAMAAAATEATNLGYSTPNGIFWEMTTPSVVQSMINASIQSMSFATTTRSLNSNYTISTTRAADVVYSINAAWTLNALLSGSGTAFLEYSTNAGSTWVTVSQVSKSLSLLTTGGADDMNLSGKIPANALVRIRTTSSNMTISFVRAQEVLLPSN